MTVLPPVPENLARQASSLTSYEQQQLWEAALLMSESRSLLVRLAALFGRQVEAVRGTVLGLGERLVGSSWSGIEEKIQDGVEEALWRCYGYATFGLGASPHTVRPQQPRQNRLHKALATTSGVVSGFVGLPGAFIDIPFTTATILRSIAEIARDSGEDLESEDTRRACLEVLAFGGPGQQGDPTEAGYWAARLGASHLTINLLVRSAAGQLGMFLSEKMLAQAVPLAGAVAGGMLNYSFTDYYQSMARVHFCLRAIERRTGDPEAVKRSFTDMLHAARARRKLGRHGRREQQFLLPGNESN